MNDRASQPDPPRARGVSVGRRGTPQQTDRRHARHDGKDDQGSPRTRHDQDARGVDRRSGQNVRSAGSRVAAPTLKIGPARRAKGARRIDGPFRRSPLAALAWSAPCRSPHVARGRDHRRSANAVTAMMPMFAVAGSRRRRRATSHPSISGRIKSSSMTAGSSAMARLSPVGRSPLRAREIQPLRAPDAR